MQAFIHFLAAALAVGPVITLPSLGITSLIQRMLKGYFYGWRRFLYGLIGGSFVSGPVAMAGIHAAESSASDVWGLAGVMLFPVFVSILYTELIYAFALQHYRMRAESSRPDWRSAGVQRYLVRVKFKPRFPRSRYGVRIYDQDENLLLESNDMKRRPGAYTEILEDGFTLYERQADSRPSLRLAYPSVHQGSKGRCDVIDCRQNERIGSLDYCNLFLSDWQGDWRLLDRSGEALCKIEYSMPRFLYRADFYKGQKQIGRMDQRMVPFVLRMHLELLTDQLDRRLALSLAALVSALAARMQTSGPGGGGA